MASICTASPERTTNQQEHCFITEDKKQAITQFVVEHLDHLYNRNDCDGTVTFYKGKHARVFSHRDFPGLIIKIMPQKMAHNSKENLDRTRIIFQANEFKYCHAPQAQVVDGLPDSRSLFIMEKALGTTDENAARASIEEEWSHILENKSMAQRWNIITKELACAIALTGYWDVGLNNLLWSSENGFSFVDFERIEPKESYQKDGLQRLIKLNICPRECAPIIHQIAEAQDIRLMTHEELARR